MKYVVQVIPSYVMGCFKLPNAICNQIESLTTRFHWSENTQEKRRFIGWEKLSNIQKERGTKLQKQRSIQQSSFG